jgi:hypothetical protein
MVQAQQEYLNNSRRQRKRNLHQGTVVLPVLGSTISMVRRQLYRHNVVLYRSLQGTVVLQYLAVP